MIKHSPLHLALVLGAAMTVTPRAVFADCAPVRPATDEEKKIYADGYALFQRLAPPTPVGWESNDAQKDGVLKEVCAGVGEKIIRHHFTRSYTLKEGMDARRAEAERKVMAVIRDGQTTSKANEAKIADVMKRMQALQAKAQQLVAAQKYAEIEALSGQIEALTQEHLKLLNVNAQDAAMDAINAEATRDTAASFSRMLNVPDLDTSAFSPVTLGTVKALRQLIPAEGSHPASADLMIVMGPAAKGPRNVVMIHGDPARAEALLRAAKLQ